MQRGGLRGRYQPHRNRVQLPVLFSRERVVVAAVLVLPAGCHHVPRTRDGEPDYRLLRAPVQAVCPIVRAVRDALHRAGQRMAVLALYLGYLRLYPIVRGRKVCRALVRLFAHSFVSFRRFPGV